MKDPIPDSRPPVSGVKRESGPSQRHGSREAVLTRLLEHAAQIQLKSGPKGVARGMLTVLASMFPKHAFGVCLVGTEDTESGIDTVLPDGLSDPGHDPTRLFPNLADEQSFTLDGLQGSTLHVGSVGTTLDGDALVLFATRHAARLLAAGARGALALRSARPVSLEVSDLRAQLVQAEKLATLGQIVAGLEHELSTPVTSIVACTDYLMKKVSAEGGRTEELEQLQRIAAAADRMVKYNRDLIGYVRPAREQAGPVALPEVVEQALTFSQHELERSSVHVVRDYADGAPAILGQSGPLTQVFINLFTNAAHAMEGAGGSVFVRTRVDKAKGRLFVDVTDSGMGICGETLPKIFEPFYTTKEKGRGTGLGLSIVREIMEAHGGSIEARSTVGEGTTFTLELLLYRQPT